MFSDLSDYVPTVHRDGRKFVYMLGGAALVMLYLWPSLGWLLVLATGAVAAFFRDPTRVTPVREGLIVAPADGNVISVMMVHGPKELGFGDAERMRVSIHLSLLDVHINRSPMAGRVVRSIYVPGAYLNPTLDKTSEENERRALVIAADDGAELAIVQIAGVVSRRIVTFAGEGDMLTAGQRIGLIRFGSRVDLYLPPGVASLVCEGQRMVAGETVVADRRSDERGRDCRRS
ncbi:MAG: Phosphatidylserine decarboxylase proenzyme [Pseudomonadota bacterium]|jgi:phosphatidylserine decarboxylase